MCTHSVGLNVRLIAVVYLVTVPGTYLMQVVHSRASGEDVGVTTHHWEHLPGVAPTEADFLTVESRMDAFWTALQAHRWSGAMVREYRWYGPLTPGVPAGQSVRVVEVDAFAGQQSTAMPSQVSVTVTERTDVRRRWGRFYIPFVGRSSGVDAAGQLTATVAGAIADAAQTAFMQDLTAWRCVVFGAPTPNSLEVRIVQVDTIYDIQRRRRDEIALATADRDVTPP